MIDHVNLPVSDYPRAKHFYTAVLGALGHPPLFEDGDALGFGADAWRFGIVAASAPVQPLHLAFAAADRAGVDRFHQTALAAGARDNGAPGVRADYDPHYYAAYVIDADGHNIEAVYRGAAQ